MSGGKGGSDKYRSQNIDSLDQLGFEMVLGGMTGQPISPSPAMTGSIVASQMGGNYDERSGNITFPGSDSVIKRNVETGEYETVSGGSDGQDYAGMANQINQQVGESIYSNSNSAYNTLFNKDSTYDPQTGTYRTLGEGEEAPQQLTSQHYMDNYGDVFNQTYNPTSYSDYQQPGYEKQTYDPYTGYATRDYQAYDYQAPQLETTENISDSARQSIYQSGADQIVQNFQNLNEATDAWVSSQGGNLSSGRAAQLYRDNQMDKGADLNKLRRETDVDHEMRTYEDARGVRDKQAEYDFSADERRGDENRYTQDFNVGENRYGYETGSDENRFGQTFNQGENRYGYGAGIEDARYGYEADQGENRYGDETAYSRGLEKLKTVEGLDAGAQDRAYRDEQADRQQGLSTLTGLNDILNTYTGRDSTAASLQAAEANAIGSALGGIAGAAGSAYGKRGGAPG